jgi:glycosyltransferase involved in cell wall biosynthesis
MKIAILTDGIYPYVIGGMQKHSFYLARFLSELGAEVSLFHCVLKGNAVPDENQVKRDLEIENPSFRSYCEVFPEAGSMPGHYVKESYAYSASIFSKLESQLNDFDFIYAKGFSAWHLLEKRRKGLKTPPIGVKFHGYEMFQKPANFRMRLEQLLLRGPVKFNNKHADVVFSYGGHITPIVESIGVERSKIHEIPTGIESSWCIQQVKSTNERPRKFVFLGRYERRKGIEELNHVLEYLVGGQDFTMHFIGPIPENKRIKSSKIVYHGRVMEKEKIQQIMDQCDVLVTPSHSEGMPNVIMEGMARGLSVIATDVGAVCDQVDQLNGWLISPASTDQLKQAMLNAIEIDDGDLLAKKSASLNRISEKFTWEHVSRQTLSEIEKITGKGTAPGRS